jgi:ubiquinone biosynthesis protein COQ9
VLADFHTTKKKGVVSDGKIYLNSKIFAKDKNDAYSTLVHEIEHRLQEIRGQQKYGGDF